MVLEQGPPMMDPRLVEVPMIDPVLPSYQTIYQFGFPQRLAAWWHRVAEGKDQTMIYTEKRGWHPSGQRSQEVDHLTPESEMRQRGLNPDNSTGIPRSKQHHTGDGLDESGELAPFGHPAWSRHPDIGEAYKAYRNGDKQAFRKAIKKHREAVERGEEFTNDDWGTRYEEDKRMTEKAARYVLHHPEDPKPVINHKKKPQGKHWYDGLFEGKRTEVIFTTTDEYKGHWVKEGIELKWVPDD